MTSNRTWENSYYFYLFPLIYLSSRDFYMLNKFINFKTHQNLKMKLSTTSIYNYFLYVEYLCVTSRAIGTLL